MTPLKSSRHVLGLPFGDGSDGDERIDSLSPPRSCLKRHLNTRLFDCGDGDVDTRRRERYHRVTRPHSGDESLVSDVSGDGSPVLRTLDMNISSSPTPHPRKRASGPRPAGREETYEDSDDSMFVSPRVSPSYRTLDGRTVTSKNPFSPYTPAIMTDEASTNAEPMQTAPTFPMSFESRTTSSFDFHDPYNAKAPDTRISEKQSSTPSFGASRSSKISLERRDQQSNHPWNKNDMVVGDGYPDRHGRYSFTGSPIDEIDILENDSAAGMGHKVRRLNLNDTPGVAERRPQLFVETDGENIAKCSQKDEISPTEVMNFPTSPTPTKPAASRYTPVRAPPPQTPMLERKTVPRSRYEDNDEEGAPRKSAGRFNQDFDIIGQLGNGSFGTVYKCLSRLDGCMYAVKAAKRKAKGVADRDRMLKEVYALAALSDQADTAAFHIVRYHQAWIEDGRLYIQTEMCTSTLHAEMLRGVMDEGRRFKLLREILLALEFIHRNGMVHLDIKPENIFIKNDQFKLGDFGLVSKISNHDVEEGDSRYMSMELLSGDTEDLTKSDIFSLGATLYEICLGRTLPTDGKEWQDIRAAVFSPLKETSYELEFIIKQMMDPDPNHRPSASELLKRRQLLSKEQKQLMDEKSKVLEANRALALQTQMLQKVPPPGRSRLMRANTWNGTLS